MKIFVPVAIAVTTMSFAAVAQTARKPVAAKPIPKASPAPKPIAAPPQLYDFKGVALETSLEDFRKLPHPDGTGAKVVCTGEKVAITSSYSSEPSQVSIYDEVEKALGVTRCVWISVGQQYGNGSPAGLSLAGSGYASYYYSFSFIKDPKDGIMRLYHYSGETNVAAFDAITEALSGKWGKPTITTGTVQNKIGNSFDQTTAIWANPLASIMVQSRWSKIDDMVVIMDDTRLSKIVTDAKAAKRAATPNAI